LGCAQQGLENCFSIHIATIRQSSRAVC
jgi:hypothetical protein